MSLPSVITPSLLNAIRTHPHLPKNTWYLLAGTALSTLNRPDEISKVFTHALTHGSEQGATASSSTSASSSSISDTCSDTKPSHTEQLTIARRTREALIKSSAIIGLPKTINALFALKAATPKHLIDEPLGFSPSARTIDMYTTPPSQIMQRGQRFFDAVYGKITKRVMGQMDRSGTEDLGLMARLEYGYVLSPVNILSAAETSHVVLACLIPQDVNPQLKGHLVGAVNNGATEQEVRAVREVVVWICEAAGMKRMDGKSRDGWGWREEVANLKAKEKL